MPNIGHQEYGFNVGIQLFIHRRHLELVLEILHGAQAAHDDVGLTGLGEFHEQPMHRHDLDLGKARPVQLGAFGSHHVDPVLQGKERLFRFIDRHADNERIDQFPGPADNVQMAVCRRVESSRI